MLLQRNLQAVVVEEIWDGEDGLWQEEILIQTLGEPGSGTP